MKVMTRSRVGSRSAPNSSGIVNSASVAATTPAEYRCSTFSMNSCVRAFVAEAWRPVSQRRDEVVANSTHIATGCYVQTCAMSDLGRVVVVAQAMLYSRICVHRDVTSRYP
jgi:hypothetical protein